jgi:hypothetical protein
MRVICPTGRRRERSPLDALEDAQKSRAPTSQICKRLQADLGRPVPSAKNISLSIYP